ncbi:DUF3892 domain-containing protein [Bradyrhizobium sp. CCGUVB1N3]|uniref:DUF3892 domain-containing protein n=1 Tax=unclassified Bradyrhizobium TaxID=2631580 RepID=UPI000487C607|nr:MULTISPECIES: DUF3892 domain-containing protein [unclassified Bradyrhizobium]MCP3475617.1 DUF3892 domain-containing protein [Bradyrhizobium sp. CCGUVB1N3]
MAKRARIRCINTTDRRNSHERLSHVGGVNPDGTPWKRSIDQAIRDIESNEWEFYVEENGRRVDVVCATHEGYKYLKTAADDIHPDNLLLLAECP